MNLVSSFFIAKLLNFGLREENLKVSNFSIRNKGGNMGRTLKKKKMIRFRCLTNL